jgi:hypothetical protein
MTTKWTQGEDDSLAFLHGTFECESARVTWRVISDVLNNWHHANRSARACQARWDRIQKEAAQ